MSNLYPRRSPRAALTGRPAAVRAAWSSGGSLKEDAELSLETGVWRIEKFTARNNDHIEPCRGLVMAEQFPGDALGAIADDRAANPPCGRDAEPRIANDIGRDEHRHQTPADLGATLVGQVEIGPAPDMFARPERRHGVVVADDGGGREEISRPVTRFSARPIPSSVCAPWRGAASAPAVHLWSPCEREIRAFACGAGYSAETFVHPWPSMSSRNFRFYINR
jgi:hypothetical protein